MRFGHTDLRIGARALLLADHERDHAGEIGLECEQLQVEHDSEMVFEYRRRALRLLDRRELKVALLLGACDAALDVADGVGVFIHLRAVLRAKFALQTRQLILYGIEDALVLPEPRLASLAISASAVAEQGLEHGARVPLHRQRL